MATDYETTGTHTQMPSGYDDTDTGPIGPQAYSAADGADLDDTAGDAAGSGGGGGSGVNWPTVMMAGGISAIISAVVVTIGVVGLLLSDIGRNGDAAGGAQPTVVNLGSAQSAAPQGAAAPPASAANPQAPAQGAAPGAAAAPAGEGSSADLPAGGGASGGGMLPGAAPQAAPQAVPQAPAAQAPAQQQSAHPAKSPAQLQNDLDTLTGNGSTAAKAQRLEGGAKAVRQAQPIATLLQRFRPMGMTYRITGPVTVTGNTMKATLELRSPGWQPARMPLYWVWQGGQWKLSNRSICDLGAYGGIPCSL
ncbi:hypothetical protein [Gordonia sp. SL306]|uniref:hypothetical protein n=1 Tax=Gordonia sp. SL306 TaxID=2995145 RepID=UPI00226FFD38|nr:hypothetical protein [Gordonia sp. SL306]WAC53772.1 hypothetical protein OVA31_13730 [Gordonia sp. SL306]